jgi:hypothetical protein
MQGHGHAPFGVGNLLPAPYNVSNSDEGLNGRSKVLINRHDHLGHVA